MQEQINTPAISELIGEMRNDYDTIINPKNVNYGKYGTIEEEIIDLSSLQAANMSPDIKGRERTSSNEIK